MEYIGLGLITAYLERMRVESFPNVALLFYVFTSLPHPRGVFPCVWISL